MTVIGVDGRARQTAGRIRLFGAALVAQLLTDLLPLPWRLTGLGFGLVAGWSGIRVLADLAALRRAGRPPRGAVGVIVGLALVTLLAADHLAQLVLYPIVAERDRCAAAALTYLDGEQCEATFRRQLEELQQRVSGGPSRP